MVQEPFIICDNLVKIYKITDLEVVALQGLELVVAPGELLGIVGVSGSGKSTLMNILGGLDRPSAGRVWVNGNDLLKMSATDLDHYRRNNVGFVWQQSARNLIPYLTAQENVELPMTLAGEIGRRRRDQAMRLLEVVGLADRCSHHLGELSGGEQQRVAIAVSLANKPQLLLADEPTGELDEATSLTIYETFNALSDELKLTTLIVSHDPGLAHHMDRVVAIRDGKTATETVRQNGEIAALAENLSDAEGVREGEVFEEFTMLDSAGRLQVPKEYLEQLNIRGRVKLEVIEEGILIRPAPPSDNAQSAELLAEGLVRREKSKGLWGFLSGLRKGSDSPEGTDQ